MRRVPPESQSCVPGFPAGSWSPLLESLSLEAWGWKPPSCPPSSSSSNIRFIRDTGSWRTLRGRAADGTMGSWIERKVRRRGRRMVDVTGWSWRSPGRAAAAVWRTDWLHRGCRSSAGCWASRSGNGFDGREKKHPPVRRESKRTNVLQSSH